EIDGGHRFSTGLWLDAVRKALTKLQRQGRTPILVGGTGLYFHALVNGLDEAPPVSEDVRADVRALVQADGSAALHAKLAEVDPETAARLEPGDRQRVSRAYEVWLATGKPISALRGRSGRPVLQTGEWLGVALTPPRARLYGRIDKRFDGMLVGGAMEEVRALVARDLDPSLPIMKAHGMPWLAAFVRGDMSAEAAAERAKRDTRRYAKRQFTWIAHQLPFWPRIPNPAIEARMKVILALYKEIDVQ
ncbi:MAG: tRNA (adenosine(37)-N6)-dimethylallyltransferase MiaA, partial [Pseudomonadota bacterium]